ncbi:MAG: hypothetical protein Q8S01_04360, partial [Ignavibacteria bacterium]|nr:hypothetical protein [Ignavibacteria bacterium]
GIVVFYRNLNTQPLSVKKEKNMIGEHLVKACVQYNDYTGTVACDIADLISLEQFLAKKGFNNKLFLPYALEFVFSEPLLTRRRSTHLEILSVKREVVGNNINDIREYANKHNNKVPTNLFSIELGVNEFFDLFKRFNITLGYQSKGGHNYQDTIEKNIIEDVSLNS